MGQAMRAAAVLAALTAAGAAGCSTPERDYTSPVHERQVEQSCRRLIDAGSSAERAAAMAELRKADGELAGHVSDLLTGNDPDLRYEAALRIAGLSRRARGASVVFASILAKSVNTDYEFRLGREPARQQLDLLVNLLGGLCRLAPESESVADLLPRYCRFGFGPEFRDHGGFFAAFLRTSAIAAAEKACANLPDLRKACVPALAETALRDRPYSYVVSAGKESRQVILDARADALRLLAGFGADGAAAAPALKLLCTHKEEKVRKAAEETLKAVGG